MRKLKVLISCGPTREPLDPVRFISNYSTGTLGITLAAECHRRGHQVTLAHGPIEVPPRLRVKRVAFESVLDLARVLRRHVRRCDVLFMVAAVSDFKPLEAAAAKIKKGARFLNLSLVQNPDVLKSLRRFKGARIFVGFSLESKNVYRSSLRKLREKDVDLMVAQMVNEKVRPFGKVPIGCMVIDARGRRKGFRSVSKDSLAKYLIREAEKLVSRGT